MSEFTATANVIPSKKETDIQREFKRLDAAISLAKDRFSMLYERLQPVTHNIPEDPSNEKEEEISGSPFAVNLFHLKQHVDGLIKTIDKTLEELQL